VTDSSTRLILRVSPGAKRSAIVGRHAEGWKVRIAAPPADGRANGSLQRFLSSVLEVPRRDVRIVAGAASREKIIEVEGRDAAQADALLAAAAMTGEDRA
jgi:uncharacterized protein (TIGR00251 family)